MQVALKPEKNNRLAQRAKDQKGQSSVLMALITVVFVAFLAFLANMGQVIHDKMLTQAVADSAALAAANIQAIGMNEIADLNAEIKDLYEDCKEDIENKDKGNREFLVGNGWATYGYYMSQIIYLYGLMDDANEEFANMARAAAERVVEVNNENYQTLYPGIQDDPHSNLERTRKWTLENVMGGSTPSDKMARFFPSEFYILNWTEYIPGRGSVKTVSSFYFQRGGIIRFPIMYSGSYPVIVPLIGRYRLMPFTRVYYRLRLRREPILALVNMRKLGFDVNVPEIVAYSQAQPHQGDTWGMEPDYEPRLAPLWQTYPNETNDNEYLSLVDEFNH